MLFRGEREMDWRGAAAAARERERESGERKGGRAKDEAPQREREAMIGWSTITRLSLSVCAFLLLSTSKYLSPSCSLSLSTPHCGSIAKTLSDLSGKDLFVMTVGSIHHHQWQHLVSGCGCDWKWASDVVGWYGSLWNRSGHHQQQKKTSLS